MDIFDSNLVSFWKSLNQYEVKYIMIGGFAVNLHGFFRTTGDLDLWLMDEKQNRLNLGKALEQFGYGELSFETLDFIPGWSDLYIGPGIRLDIVTKMLGLENISFEDALNYANVADIHGIKIPFLHINQLIKNKKATSRPKDIIDVIELEKIMKIREEKRKS